MSSVEIVRKHIRFLGTELCFTSTTLIARSQRVRTLFPITVVHCVTLLFMTLLFRAVSSGL